MEKYEGDILKLVNLGQQIGAAEAAVRQSEERARQLAQIVLNQHQRVQIPDAMVAAAIAPYIAGVLPAAQSQYPQYRPQHQQEQDIIEAVLAETSDLVPFNDLPIATKPIPSMRSAALAPAAVGHRSTLIQVGVYLLLLWGAIIWREPIWGLAKIPLSYIQQLATHPKSATSPTPSAVAPSPSAQPLPVPEPPDLDMNQRVRQQLGKPIAPY